MTKITRFIAFILFFVCICLPGLVNASESTWETLISAPNLNVTSNFDLDTSRLLPGASASVLSYKSMVDLQFGYVKDEHAYIPSVGICLNLGKISGLNVDYVWKDIIKTSLGVWAGYSLDTHVLSGGLNMSLISIKK